MWRELEISTNNNQSVKCAVSFEHPVIINTLST